MGNFSMDMPIDEILERMNNNRGNTEIMHAGPCFLQYKFHQELIQDLNVQHKELVTQQQKFQEKNLDRMTKLVIATWALVAATVLLTFYK